MSSSFTISHLNKLLKHGLLTLAFAGYEVSHESSLIGAEQASIGQLG